MPKEESKRPEAQAAPAIDYALVGLAAPQWLGPMHSGHALGWEVNWAGAQNKRPPLYFGTLRIIANVAAMVGIETKTPDGEIGFTPLVVIPLTNLAAVSLVCATCGVAVNGLSKLAGEPSGAGPPLSRLAEAEDRITALNKAFERSSDPAERQVVGSQLAHQILRARHELEGPAGVESSAPSL